MKAALYILLLSTCFQCAQSQQPDTAALKEVRLKLAGKKSNTSSILMNPAYLHLHPETSFRELIRQHATTDTLKIAPLAEPGKKIVINVTVSSETGSPVPNALVYLYQTDSRGWYSANSPHVQMNQGDMRHARLFGYVKTNANGQFNLVTVKPSGYPKSDLPAHIHIHVDAPGMASYVTELLFDDDERLKGEIRENAIRDRYPISKPERTGAGFQQRFEYKLVIGH